MDKYCCVVIFAKKKKENERGSINRSGARLIEERTKQTKTKNNVLV